MYASSTRFSIIHPSSASLGRQPRVGGSVTRRWRVIPAQRPVLQPPAQGGTLLSQINGRPRRRRERYVDGYAGGRSDCSSGHGWIGNELGRGVGEADRERD